MPELHYTTRVALLMYRLGYLPDRYHDEDFGSTTYGYGLVDEFGLFEYLLPFVPENWKGKFKSSSIFQDL